MFGGNSEDQLLGGGGDDRMFGGADSDRIEGHNGRDESYGGSGIDILVLDVDPLYDPLPPGQREIFDGHFGNLKKGDAPDDNATDILLIEGTNGEDTILLSQTPTGLLRVRYTDDSDPHDSGRMARRAGSAAGGAVPHLWPGRQ